MNMKKYKRMNIKKDEKNDYEKNEYEKEILK
jgi:hypothetical protein